VVVGVSFDSVDNNRAFADKLGYPYKLVSDVGKSLAGYDAIDPDDPEWPRRISYLIGPDRRIVKSYATVDVATHAATVLADVAAHAAT